MQTVKGGQALLTIIVGNCINSLRLPNGSKEKEHCALIHVSAETDGRAQRAVHKPTHTTGWGWRWNATECIRHLDLGR